MGAPGCPELACCTASIAKVRIVLMHRVSSCLPVTKVCSLAAMRLAFLQGRYIYPISRLPNPLECWGTARVSDKVRVYQFSPRLVGRVRGKTGLWKKVRTALTSATEGSCFRFSRRGSYPAHT